MVELSVVTCQFSEPQDPNGRFIEIFLRLNNIFTRGPVFLLCYYKLDMMGN